MASENRERQVEEVQGLASIYTVEVLRPEGVTPEELDAASPAWPAAGMVVAIRVPVEAEEAVVTATLCDAYPSDAAAGVTLKFPGLRGRAKEEALLATLAEEVLADVGFEQLMPAVMHVAQEGAAALEELAAADAAAAAKKAGAAAAAAAGPMVRCWYYIDHMLQGRQHKKEAECFDALQGSGLTGCAYCGHPAVVALEGQQAAIDDVIRLCKKAGKSPTIKKTQSMPDGHKSRLWAKFVVAGATAPGGIDKDALHGDVEKAGIATEFKYFLNQE